MNESRFRQTDAHRVDSGDRCRHSRFWQIYAYGQSRFRQISADRTKQMENHSIARPNQMHNQAESG